MKYLQFLCALITISYCQSSDNSDMGLNVNTLDKLAMLDTIKIPYNLRKIISSSQKNDVR